MGPLPSISALLSGAPPPQPTKHLDAKHCLSIKELVINNLAQAVHHQRCFVGPFCYTPAGEEHECSRYGAKLCHADTALAYAVAQMKHPGHQRSMKRLIKRYSHFCLKLEVPTLPITAELIASFLSNGNAGDILSFEFILQQTHAWWPETPSSLKGDEVIEALEWLKNSGYWLTTT
ncbi:hypothetical protein RQP46_005443 [Phenoliferia psychrophenolica]